jgi:hypothetical protein
MANIAANGVAKRDAQFRDRLGVLAYELYCLTARQKEIEIEIGQVEVAREANTLARKDIETDAAIEAAQTEAKESNG